MNFPHQSTSTARRHQQIHLFQTIPTQRSQHSLTGLPSSRSSIVKTLDCKYCEDTRLQNQLSATQEQHKGLRYPPHHLFGSEWHHLQQSHPEAFQKLSLLDSQRVKKLDSKLHVHFVNFAAKLVHTRRALSSTIINSHQEPVSGQACNPLDPH